MFYAPLGEKRVNVLATASPSTNSAPVYIPFTLILTHSTTMTTSRHVFASIPSSLKHQRKPRFFTPAFELSSQNNPSTSISFPSQSQALGRAHVEGTVGEGLFFGCVAKSATCLLCQEPRASRCQSPPSPPAAFPPNFQLSGLGMRSQSWLGAHFSPPAQLCVIDHQPRGPSLLSPSQLIGLLIGEPCIVTEWGWGGVGAWGLGGTRPFVSGPGPIPGTP